jgi:hypothetical protein
MGNSERGAVEGYNEAINACQKVLRLTTGVILVAFLLIIATTTFSTGPFVQTAGKVLYYVIVVDALISLGTWYYRTRLEKHLPEAEAPAPKG